MIGDVPLVRSAFPATTVLISITVLAGSAKMPPPSPWLNSVKMEFAVFAVTVQFVSATTGDPKLSPLIPPPDWD